MSKATATAKIRSDGTIVEVLEISLVSLTSSLRKNASPSKRRDDSILDNKSRLGRPSCAESFGIKDACFLTYRPRPGCRPIIRCGRYGRSCGEVLKDLSRTFGELYASEGRPSIPPEQLVSALLLQACYGIRSERQLMEQLDYNITCFIAGLSVFRPMIAYGTRRPSRRIATGCSKATCFKNS